MKTFHLDFTVAYEHFDCDSGPYVHIWRVTTPWGSLRLHKWVGDDDHRALHDHPWAFWTLILKGAYLDVQGRVKDAQGHDQGKYEPMRAGTLRFRPAKHTHTVKLLTPTCWTLVLTGPKVREFGFVQGGKWTSNVKWFKTMPKFVCSG